MKLEIYSNGNLVNTFTQGVETSLIKQFMSYYVFKNSIFTKVKVKRDTSLHCESLSFMNKDLEYKYIDIDL